jgi:hypothetical protein
MRALTETMTQRVRHMAAAAWRARKLAAGVHPAPVIVAFRDALIDVGGGKMPAERA